jgi:signal transduction histidine kinase
MGAVEVLDDVTDVRRLQEAVERGERLKSLGEMAAGVAHEIRNPLNGIEGFASLLVRDLGAESRSARHAQAIVTGVRDLNRTVSGLLQFTQQREPQLRQVPLAEIVNDVYELVQAELANQDETDSGTCELRCVISDDWQKQRLAVDPSQIRHILLNLLQNAVQACEGQDAAQARIELNSDESGHARIAITDSGPGVPEHLRQDIFTPFFTTKDHGTGLGLAIVHSMVLAHQGQLRVEQASDLGGACFLLTLPSGERLNE